MVSVTFQSTLPARGATDWRKHRTRQAVAFQSTLPARGATRQTRSPRTSSSPFQSTLPARGATSPATAIPAAIRISIHAPREGSDASARPAARVISHHFNPRSPRGERQDGALHLHLLCNISIHAPREGSDEQVIPLCRVLLRFQSTLPARGATIQEDEQLQEYKFQSTLPARGATVGRAAAGTDNPISIHAPREGSDHSEVFICPPAELFQSTLPARGATCLTLRQKLVEMRISIHAPREGSDSFNDVAFAFAKGDFNPRSPRGERPRLRRY